MTDWLEIFYLGFAFVWIVLTVLALQIGKGIQDKIFFRTKICLTALFMLTAITAIASLLFGKIKDGHIEILNTATLLLYYIGIQIILFELQVLYRSKFLNYHYIILPNIPVATLIIPYMLFHFEGHFASYYSLSQFKYALLNMDEYVIFRLYILLTMGISLGYVVVLVVRARKEFLLLINNNYTEIDIMCVKESKKIALWAIAACIPIFLSNIFVSPYLEVLIFSVLTVLYCYLVQGFHKYTTTLKQTSEFMESEQNDELEAQTSTFNIQELEGMIAPMVEAWTKLDTKPFLRNGITLQEAAEMMDVPRKDLSAYIRKILNVNFFYWINSLRIEECKRLIKEQKLNFTEIADECGFADLATMSKAFKKICGVSPSAYKKEIKLS